MGQDYVEDVIEKRNNTQWIKSDDVYSPSPPTVAELPPGYYVSQYVYGSLHFVKKSIMLDGLIETVSSNSQNIVDDFKKFWKLEDKFNLYGIPYKRGVLMSGPPGSGKTCIIKILSNIVVSMGGIVLDIRGEPNSISDAMDAVRSVQPNVPVLMPLEDLDKYYSRISHVLLNIMDGLYNAHKFVFIATTNHPELFEDALINRPGRFDTHYRILPPMEKVREDFIKQFLNVKDLEIYPISKWVKDTEGLPLGHIKEMMISVVLFGKDYDSTLYKLKNMSQGVKDGDYDE